jgi:hypothetical protein
VNALLRSAGLDAIVPSNEELTRPHTPTTPISEEEEEDEDPMR